MSDSVIVVNADGPETRVALIESGILSEFYVERERERGTVGNVYKGKVLSAAPNTEWAFHRLSLLHTRKERWNDLLSLYDGALAHEKDGSRRNTLLDEAAADGEELLDAVDAHDHLAEVQGSQQRAVVGQDTHAPFAADKS